MSASQWCLLVLLSLVWGGSFLFVAVSVQELPPLTIVLARVAGGAALLVPVALILGYRLPRALAQWRAFAFMAILNNVIPFTLIVWGQQYITTGLASVLNATTPLWGVLIAHVLTDEKLKANRFAGVLVGVTGVAVLVGPEAWLGNRSSVAGMLCVLGASISYGVSSVWARRFTGTPALVSASSQMICSTLLLLPLALLIDRPWTLPLPSSQVIASLVALAALSTALAYVIFFRIMAVSGPSNAMLVTLLIPINAVLLGHWVLGEAILARHVVGGLIILGALLVIDGRILPRRPAPAS